MTGPFVERPQQHVRFVGPGAGALSNRPRSRRRALAAGAVVAAMVIAVVVPLGMSGSSSVSGGPVAAGSVSTTAPSPTRSTSKRPATTTSTSRRSILEPEPDANPAACNIVSWQDLPADVRSATFTPAPRSTENPDVFMCWLDNSELGVVVRGPSDSRRSPGDDQPSSRYFKVNVYLGKPINADVNNHRGNPKLDEVREVTVGGEYPGVLVRDRANDGRKDIPRCFVAFRTARNKALVEITNDRFSHHDVCDLAMRLAETIAPRVR